MPLPWSWLPFAGTSAAAFSLGSQNMSSSDDSAHSSAESTFDEENSDADVSDTASTTMSGESHAGSRVILARSKTKMALMRHNLSNGQRVLHKIRCRVSGLLLMLGLVCSVCVMFEYSRSRSLEDADVLDTGKYIDQVIFGFLLYFCQIVCCCLAPLQDDAKLTRLALLQLATVALLGAIFQVWPAIQISLDQHAGNECSMYGMDMDPIGCHLNLAQLCMRMTALAFMVVGNLVTMFFSDPDRMQRCMWTIAATFLLVEILAILMHVIVSAILLHIFDPMAMRFLGMLPSMVLSRASMLRSRFQVWVTGFFSYRNNRAAAAGIAGLVGNCSIPEVMSQAKKRFRCVDFSRLDRQELSTNKPSPTCFTLSRHIKLGCCDAFISHSWHDDAPAKWEAMTWWKSMFQNSRQRSPMIWLDKCCIDQSDIEADLRCLPIFLSGCHELVVFCGPTYLSRLWCIMELFTFVHIGCKLHEINVIPLLRRGHIAEDRAALRDSFLNFDVMNCETASTPPTRIRCWTLSRPLLGTSSSSTTRCVLSSMTSIGCAPAPGNGNGGIPMQCRTIAPSLPSLRRRSTFWI
ncbi:unnamed protein product [Effrenium voratum]|nr:unnamed protein product [Effrenium voratum]